jgi:hypothetical protein
MATENSTVQNAQTIDLTGLPENVAQEIRNLVKTLRTSLLAPQHQAANDNAQPLRGRFADPNLQISKEEIDAAQRDAWVGFPREFPEPNNS